MTKKINLALFFALAIAFISTTFGQAVPVRTGKQLTQAEIDAIIAKFTNKEKEFRQALDSYSFRRNATIQTIGMGGQVTGELREDSLHTFTPGGERTKKVLFAPISTLPLGFITKEDMDDLGGVNPFALEASAIHLYNFTYVGKERIDELDLYVFDVAPKVMPNPKKSSQRVFTGRIWVDDHDLQIVKTRGKAGPETKDDKFPTVETWRDQVDGKYWFPVYASSDDVLVWDNGYTAKIKMRVRYQDYNVGKTDVKILDDDGETTTVDETTKPANPPKKP
jgi:hypothetical protein